MQSCTLPINCHLSEITELKYTSLIKMVILEQNFKWNLEAFASELFICKHDRLPHELRITVRKKCPF